jgi:hypothetical protein
MGLKVISLPVLYSLVVVSGKFGWGIVTASGRLLDYGSIITVGACLTVVVLLLWAYYYILWAFRLLNTVCYLK